MTISTSQSSQTLFGNGSTTAFKFSFVGDSSSYISVYYTDASGNVTLLAPALYTLFLNPAATGQIWGIGGTVTYPLSGSPIANGTSLTIARVEPLQQLISIGDQGDFSPEVIEQGLDKLEMQIQQVSARTGSFRGTWASGIFYNYADIVIDGANGGNSGNYYMCALANTSVAWSSDLAAGDWVIAIQTTAPVASLPLTPGNGGLGVANGALNTLTYTGNYPLRITLAGSTAVTFPRSGTLLTSGPNTFTDVQTITAGAITVLVLDNTTVASTQTYAKFRANSGASLGFIGATTAHSLSVLNSSGSVEVLSCDNLGNLFLNSGLIGTPTNGNATAGNVGEVISSTVNVGSAVAMTTNTPLNVTSISLTPGDWEVTGNILYLSTAATSITVLLASISTVSGAADLTSYTRTKMAAIVPGNGTFYSLTPNAYRVKVAAGPNQIVYLVGLGTFTVDTLNAYGIINARRMR